MEDIVEFNDRSILLRVKKAHVRNESFSHLCLNQQVAEQPLSINTSTLHLESQHRLHLCS